MKWTQDRVVYPSSGFACGRLFAVLAPVAAVLAKMSGQASLGFGMLKS